MDIFTASRKSRLDLQTIYFWTATINNWKQLLIEDTFKEVIILSLDHLSKAGLIKVYAFVIMPNHIHLIWKLIKESGGEYPNASFLKFTAHQFKKMLSESDLINYQVNAANKNYEFWKRDSLGIALWTRDVAIQKLDYIHQNPVNERWSLADEPAKYRYSSAAFYEFGSTDFPFLHHIQEEI